MPDDHAPTPTFDLGASRGRSTVSLWSRRLVAAMIAAAVMAGPPLLLLVLLQSSVLRIPTTTQVGTWLAEPLSAQAVSAGLLAAAGLVWLAITALVLAGTLRRLRQGMARIRRLSLPTPAQATASSLAGAALFGVSADTAHAPVPAGAPPATADVVPPPSTSAADARGGGSPRQDTAPDGRLGVDVPGGGWLSPRTATDVAAAAGLLWLRRRRSYRPAPLAGVRDDRDTDLAPVPPTVAAVQAAAQPNGSLESRTASLHRPDVPASANCLPAGPVRLVGAGAEDAVRGIIVTVLMSTVRDDPDRPRIIIADVDLISLFGDRAGHVRTVAGLHVTATVDAALDVFAHEPVSVSLLGPLPLAVIATVPDPDRVAAAVTTSPLKTVVLLAAVGSNAVWKVDGYGDTQSHGSTTAAVSRLCVLNARTAVDLLTVLPKSTTTAAENIRPALNAPSVPSARAFDRRVPRAAPVLQINLLGGARILHRGEPVTIRRSAAMHVLCLLAVHRTGATALELTEAIWPGVRPHTLTGRLYTTISDLRRTLQPFTDSQVVVRMDDRYRLHPDAVDVDVWRFDDAVTDVDRAVEIGDRRTALQKVVESYEGELCADVAWPWLHAARERVRRQVLDAYAALIDIATAPEALNLLRQAAHIDPLNESVHLRLLTTLTAAGDHLSAADVHDTYLRRLADAGLRPCTYLEFDRAAPTSAGVVGFRSATKPGTT
jgi:DNA-binding SARP family transcriptional activator